jgi:hypothetical protein
LVWSDQTNRFSSRSVTCDGSGTILLDSLVVVVVVVVVLLIVGILLAEEDMTIVAFIVAPSLPPKPHIPIVVLDRLRRIEASLACSNPLLLGPKTCTVPARRRGEPSQLTPNMRRPTRLEDVERVS